MEEYRMYHITSLRWTTCFENISYGEVYFAIYAPPPVLGLKPDGSELIIEGVKRSISHGVLICRFSPGHGEKPAWEYMDGKPVDPRTKVFAVASLQNESVYPNPNAEGLLCDTSNRENYGTTERDFNIFDPSKIDRTEDEKQTAMLQKISTQLQKKEK
jgi:hypothetical protein